MDARARLLAISAAIAVVLIGGAVILDATGGSGGADPGAAGGRVVETSAPVATAPAPAATAPVPGGTEPPAVAPIEPVLPGVDPTAAPVPAPAVDPTAGGADPAAPLEVSPPSAEETGLPSSAPRPALVSLPLPAAASSSDRLVPGYPTAVAGPLPQSFLAASSVAPDGDVLRAGLSATVALDAAAITEAFRVRLVALGFTSVEAEAPAGGTATLFTAGADSVSLSTTPTGTPRTAYSLVSVLHAGSAG